MVNFHSLHLRYPYWHNRMTLAVEVEGKKHRKMSKIWKDLFSAEIFSHQHETRWNIFKHHRVAVDWCLSPSYEGCGILQNQTTVKQTDDPYFNVATQLYQWRLMAVDPQTNWDDRRNLPMSEGIENNTIFALFLIKRSIAQSKQLAFIMDILARGLAGGLASPLYIYKKLFLSLRTSVLDRMHQVKVPSLNQPKTIPLVDQKRMHFTEGATFPKTKMAMDNHQSK